MAVNNTEVLTFENVEQLLSEPTVQEEGGQVLSFNDIEKNIESKAQDIISRYGLEEDSDSSVSSFDKLTDDDITTSSFKSVGLDVNSTSHKWDLATDDAGKEFYSTLAMIAETVGADETAKDFRNTSEEFRKTREAKPNPDISMSITEESSKIYDRFSKGEILGAIGDTAEFVHSALVGAAPSLIATGAAVGGGVVAAPVLTAVGVPTMLTVSVLGLTPGLLLSAGSIHDEAIKYGASKEEAQAVGLGAGTAIGLLDRIGFGFLISGLTKKLGKDLTVKTIKDQTNLPEKTIKEAVETAEDIAKKGVIKEAVKGAGKGALGEGVTEGTQAVVQDISPALVSDKEIKGAELLKNVIDSAAVGGIAGGTLRGTLSGASVGVSRQANRQIQEDEEVIDKLVEAIPENVQSLERFDPNKPFILNEDGTPTNTIPRSKTQGLSETERKILDEREAIESRDKIIDLPRTALTAGREVETVYDFDNDIEVLSREREQLVRKQKQQGDKFSKDDKKRLDEVTVSLRNRKGGTSNNFILNLVARSTAPLQRLANTSPVAKRMVQDLTNFFVESNQEIGSLYKTKELINDRIRKNFKLPFQSSIPKKIKTEVANQLNYRDYNSTNPEVVEVARQIREEILDPLYVRLQASGVDIGRVDEYLTRIFKLRPKGLGRKKDINKFVEILNRNGLNGNSIMDNILENDGVYNPEGDINIFVPNTTDTSVSSTRIDPENPRRLPDEVIKELQDAKLLETDFDKIVNKYIVSAVRRAKLKKYADTYNPVINQLVKDRVMEVDEALRIKNIVDALQHRYKPIKSRGLRTALRFLNTSTYIATLPFAAITALSEPFIVLSRVSPKNALMGAMAAAESTLRQGIRTFAPKFSRSQNEEALMSLMQTADLALADAIRDIGDISVSKRATDTFFRVNLLAQVTQFSRNVALQAASRQIAQDLKTLHNQEVEGGKVTQESRRARKRLEIGGLLSVVPRVNKKTGEFDPLTQSQREAMEWADQYSGAKKYGVSTEPMVSPPDIITQAMGKTVDEVIMTPNPLNKPLWMSDPRWSFAALLKGFMITFGNTVGMRFYKEIAQPIFTKGRLPDIGDAAKWAMTWTLLTGAILGTMTLKNGVRYGEEESPYDDLDIYEKILQALIQSNILGYGNVFIDALRAERYGRDPLTSLGGPVVSKVADLITALGSGSPKRIATAIGNTTPIGALPKVSRPDVGLEELIEDLTD